MSGNKYLLDTNVIIALFANEAAVIDQLDQAEEVFISSITIGELCYGANKSSRTEENLARINELILNSSILVCNAITAQYYGKTKNQLRLKGRPLPENDIWIAALAFQHNLILVTRDAHFQEIENLKSTVW